MKGVMAKRALTRLHREDAFRPGGRKMRSHTQLRQHAVQEQRMVMNMSMQQAFHVLQLPTVELAGFLEQEIEKNPILTLPSSAGSSIDPSYLPKSSTLYDHLLSQIPFHFREAHEREVARYFAGSLDHLGLLTLSPEEIKGHEAILSRFQKMDPLGVGARSVQEALLIQLEDRPSSPLRELISYYYEDLLHLRLTKIAKKMHLSQEVLHGLIQKDLQRLNPFPGKAFETTVNPQLVADIQLFEEEGAWKIEVNSSSLPPIKIDLEYEQALQEETISPEDKSYIRSRISAGNWLMQIVERRKMILIAIGRLLLKRNLLFFQGELHEPSPLKMKEVAKALSLSESTVTRAILNKSIASPRGIHPLRMFFNQSHPAKELLRKLIKEEREPLTDEALSILLSRRGAPCSRRTVAKYRRQLNIEPASKRKLQKERLS